MFLLRSPDLFYHSSAPVWAGGWFFIATAVPPGTALFVSPLLFRPSRCRIEFDLRPRFESIRRFENRRKTAGEKVSDTAVETFI